MQPFLYPQRTLTIWLCHVLSVWKLDQRSVRTNNLETKTSSCVCETLKLLLTKTNVPKSLAARCADKVNTF